MGLHVTSSFSLRHQRATEHQCPQREQSSRSELHFWKYHLHCVRNSITTVTLTNEHGLSINSQHTSTAKPWQQENRDGELKAAEWSQKSLHKKGTDIFIHRSIQCIREPSLRGLSRTHQRSLTEVKAMHYSHLICIKKLTNTISKNSDNINLYLN